MLYIYMYAIAHMYMQLRVPLRVESSMHHW